MKKENGSRWMYVGILQEKENIGWAIVKSKSIGTVSFLELKKKVMGVFYSCVKEGEQRERTLVVLCMT
jgi:hypothetical protein